MSAEVQAADSVVSRPPWPRIALAVVFGLFYAYDVWEVVASAVQILGLGLGFSAIGWVIMVAALLAPFVCFAAAFLIGRRRGLLVAVLSYATGLAVSAVLFFSLTVLLGASGAVVV
jgi:hypothetical protein